jgi:hypothetical protein
MAPKVGLQTRQWRRGAQMCCQMLQQQHGNMAGAQPAMAGAPATSVLALPAVVPRSHTMHEPAENVMIK